jgi:hypothetical protein
MAFDAEPGQEPQHAYCPGCQRAILPGAPATNMHFDKDPYGKLGLSGEKWHAECASPLWNKSVEIRRRWGLPD